ncbi:MAG: sigma-70 family RNA polymerase sigma factor [Anaeromicrobium sp.]|uniref:sigma-70 family RNA polymerase sigma factor n=1 Tax=Anaeromicrobium sp. TaxID=1929132 RepID=UPI0025EC1D14|nr:sigma-70 family RNA polymerase sigma factor [Anaeromicrobium sp.]MCT4593158.1 sigma-70 family RNA polymerase sigma factor [Anaeromicrobium sp.]
MYNQELVTENMGLVHMVCQKYRQSINGIIDYEDLAGVGTEGLIKAAQIYDPSRGVKFSTVAVTWIKGYVMKFIRNWSDGIKYPRQVKLDSRDIVEKNLIESNPEEIANKLKISVYRAKAALDYYKHKEVRYLDEPVHDGEGKTIVLKDRIGCESQENSVDKQLLLNAFIGTLTKREKLIVELQFKGESQTQIGKIIGISQAQVGRIIKNIYVKAETYGKENIVA